MVQVKKKQLMQTISSYASMVGPNEGTALEFVPANEINGVKCAKLVTEDLEDEVAYWQNAVICCVLRANPPLKHSAKQHTVRDERHGEATQLANSFNRLLDEETYTQSKQGPEKHYLKSKHNFSKTHATQTCYKEKKQAESIMWRSTNLLFHLLNNKARQTRLLMGMSVQEFSQPRSSKGRL
ncbi:hypothetical protein Cgig2_032085 [Carnegiea gigantea]|uniref:Uncharacterized protein n=1 Tax=Carnegiea gigantea TaxID=171969 RepID=A0A9Q1JEL8_9CARY|nr:hypothetical protein Cgig2_032085 [Carnegiea gigantea]